MTKKTPLTPAQEKARFVAAARELGCDESPKAFEETVKKLAAAPPTTNANLKKGRKKK